MMKLCKFTQCSVKQGPLTAYILFSITNYLFSFFIFFLYSFYKTVQGNNENQA